MRLSQLTNFIVLGGIKLLARTFYKIESSWIHDNDLDPWKDVRLIALLNHTSLFEPLFLGAGPWRTLWRMSGRIIAPGADVTMERPIAGTLLTFIAPKMVPISRERDETWDSFLEAVKEYSVVIIAPEGRMKRSNGLDKDGRPMSVRGGVADILEMLETGQMVLAYSGGLHHVQSPGQGLPKLFKRIQIRFEKLDIENYLEVMRSNEELPFKKAVTSDFERRMAKHIPRHSEF